MKDLSRNQNLDFLLGYLHFGLTININVDNLKMSGFFGYRRGLVGGAVYRSVVKIAAVVVVWHDLKTGEGALHIPRVELLSVEEEEGGVSGLSEYAVHISTHRLREDADLFSGNDHDVAPRDRLAYDSLGGLFRRPGAQSHLVHRFGHCVGCCLSGRFRPLIWSWKIGLSDLRDIHGALPFHSIRPTHHVAGPGRKGRHHVTGW